MTAAESESDFNLTTETQYLTLTGKLWGVHHQYFGDNRLPYNHTTLDIQSPNFVITMPADVLASKGARPSTGTALTTKLCIFSVQFLCLWVIQIHIFGQMMSFIMANKIWRNSISMLTHKQLETHGCILSTVATDALVLKHQAISIHSVDQIFITLDQFNTEILQQ